MPAQTSIATNGLMLTRPISRIRLSPATSPTFSCPPLLIKTSPVSPRHPFRSKDSISSIGAGSGCTENGLSRSHKDFLVNLNHARRDPDRPSPACGRGGTAREWRAVGENDHAAADSFCRVPLAAWPSRRPTFSDRGGERSADLVGDSTIGGAAALRTEVQAAAVRTEGRAGDFRIILADDLQDGLDRTVRRNR